MDKDGIKKLAELSRLELKDAEIDKYSKELSGILGYIEKIKDVAESDDDSRIENAGTRNVMREDENPHEGGENTEAILENTPDQKDGYFKVKKIL